MRFPELDGMSPEEAREIYESMGGFDAWYARTGRPADGRTIGAAQSALAELAEQAYENDERRTAEAGRTHASIRRRDRDQILASVGRIDRLPRRLEDVYRLCVVQGKSLDAAAAELGVSRHTVRSHLRRLRLLVRRPLSSWAFELVDRSEGG